MVTNWPLSMKNSRRLQLILTLAVGTVALTGKVLAGTGVLLCQFNKGRPIAASSIDNGGAFTLRWSDGPKQSYVWVGSNADQHNITDSLGGRWHYSDHRNGRSFTLWNLDNQNLIECN